MGRPIKILTIATLAFAAGTVVSFFTLPFWVVTAINAAKDGARSDWLGFSGSVIAGTMTLVAAIIAWFAVNRQIQAQETTEKRSVERSMELQTNEWEAAKYAAKIVLAHTVHAAAAVMNVTEQFLEASSQPGNFGNSRKVEIAKTKLDTVILQLRATMEHFAVSEAWKDLGFEDKGNYLAVTSTLYTVANIYSNPPPIPLLELVRNQQGTLTKFAIYLRAFDDELADIYERDSKL